MYYALRCDRVLKYEVGKALRVHPIAQQHGFCAAIV